MTSTLRDYYNRNTRLFLWLGGSRQTMSIHRAVWGPGVRSRAQALNYTNHLILKEVRPLLTFDQSAHVLDLGCGVGGSLLFLAQELGDRLRGTGVTLSPLQANLAQENARRLGFAENCIFLEGDYLALPALPPADLAFAVESFVLGPDPAAFFRSAAGVVRPGGRLVICDDFLSPAYHHQRVPPAAQPWIEAFQTGWHAPNLLTPQQAILLAQEAGFQLSSEQSLNPYLRLHSLRDRWVSLAVRLGHFIPLRRLLGGLYWDSLVGGNALHHAQTNGWMSYHFLVFDKLDRVV